MVGQLRVLSTSCISKTIWCYLLVISLMDAEELPAEPDNMKDQVMANFQIHNCFVLAVLSSSSSSSLFLFFYSLFGGCH